MTTHLGIRTISPTLSAYLSNLFDNGDGDLAEVGVVVTPQLLTEVWELNEKLRLEHTKAARERAYARQRKAKLALVYEAREVIKCESELAFLGTIDLKQFKSLDGWQRRAIRAELFALIRAGYYAHPSTPDEKYMRTPTPWPGYTDIELGRYKHVNPA